MVVDILPGSAGDPRPAEICSYLRYEIFKNLPIAGDLTAAIDFSKRVGCEKLQLCPNGNYM